MSRLTLACLCFVSMLVLGSLWAGQPLSMLPEARLAAAEQAADPTIDQVLDLADRYVVGYVERLPLLLATETYSQWTENLDEVNRAWHRTLISEFALVRLGSGDDWAAYRDTYKVGNARLRDATDRIERLFVQGADVAGHAAARRLSNDSAAYNFASIGKAFNAPTIPLFFLRPASRPRFTHKKIGEGAISGVPTWKLEYVESRRPTLFRSPEGFDLPVQGTFWISPADGRVLQTHMEIDMRTASASVKNDTSASIRVTYKPDPVDGVLVPAEMLETYEFLKPQPFGGKDARTRVNCTATYAGYKRPKR